MAVRFRKNLATLVRDLGRGGFPVRLVENVSGARGRSADLYLYNDVVVSWDPYSQTIWPEGPHSHCRRVETYLRALYEGRWFARKCLTSWFVMTATIRQPMQKLTEQLRATVTTDRALNVKTRRSL
ncbi:hypothetical protein DB347_14615 [Opitutaceae bacterium EW11]|nr:hypothetical protein DB347_14615 [Opitutaceae bacterium EW11]